MRTTVAPPSTHMLWPMRAWSSDRPLSTPIDIET
jgi:hypothetical protein